MSTKSPGGRRKRRCPPKPERTSMFSDETQGLIDTAFHARETATAARTDAKAKTAAREEAARAESTALGALDTATSDLKSATDAAMVAIAGELALPDEDSAEPKSAPPPAARPRPQLAAARR